MGFKKANYHLDVDFEIPKKLPWYWAPFFTAFWFSLYVAVVCTQIDHLPKPLTRRDELKHPDAFIAERAEETLLGLTRLGPKVVGSEANEVHAVQFLLAQVEKIREQASDYFTFEVNVQQATGNYVHWSMINMYQGVQNVVVKLSAANATSGNYVLINSHFDSVPNSPGAGDDCSMVSTMLEVMRVISKGNGPLTHPLVFLFNGAEENPLQASHGFITQHQWAKNCKALINLDAAGSGGREILFQSGPDHPWLMRYYRQVPHPFANTMGEEMFQAGLIPSDTDFRIFRDYGGVPGLDMAYIFHGYVYHTEFDKFNVFPKASLQNTGDNVLSLAKSIGNAPEMEDTSLHSKGHVIFYDFLGWFIVFYTLNTGVVINCVVSAVAFAAIGVSLYFMSVRSGLSWKSILKRYAITFAIQIVSIALGIGFNLLIAVFMDGVGCSMSWFASNWIIIGLYFCPMFFSLGILASLYLERTKTDALSLGFRIQLFMHSHCLCLILLTIILTAMGIRSSFLAMMAVFFDIVALIVNLITRWHRKAYWFAIAAMVCQILPFLYYTSVTQATYFTIIPMTGRSGSDANPDLVIAVIAIFFSLLFAGFLMPLYMFFKKTRTIMLCFLGVSLLFIIIAVTPAGFPYKAKVAPQRYSLIHVHRTLHNPDDSVRIDESGIYVYPQDRQYNTADDVLRSIGEQHNVNEYCEKEMFCGMPLYNHRWHKAREYSFWIPVEEKPSIPSEKPQLTKVNIEQLDAPEKQRYTFSLAGPDHMTIFIQPLDKATINDWSFNKTMLTEKWEPPYFIYFSYGNDPAALEFTIDVDRNDDDLSKPCLEIGIAGHWIHQETIRSDKYEKVVQSFPDYATITDWVATYESWMY